MRICVDLTPLYDHLTGIERYNLNISRSLINNHPENNYILLFKEVIHSEFLNIAKQENVDCIVLSNCNKLFFIQVKLLNALNKIKADYYLFLSFTSPMFFRRKGVVNAIHDLTCWDCADSIPFKMRLYYRLTYKIAALTSWKIITVSKYSQKRICEKYNLNLIDVPVVYDGLTDIFQNIAVVDSEIKKKYNLPDNYILSVSTIEPRKNLQLLLRAFSELSSENRIRTGLVLVGRNGWKLDEINKFITDSVRDKVIFTGFIEDNDLPKVYNGADVFVFPSKYEGFGLPIIEALSQGDKVVCSDAASLPEIADEFGVLFKSDDIEDLKEKLLKAVEQENDEERISKAIRWAKGFNWDVEAEKLHSILLGGVIDE